MADTETHLISIIRASFRYLFSQGFGSYKKLLANTVLLPFIFKNKDQSVVKMHFEKNAPPQGAHSAAS